MCQWEEPDRDGVEYTSETVPHNDDCPYILAKEIVEKEEFNNMSLAEKYMAYVDMNRGDEKKTFDDFYDWAGIPDEQRTSFGTAAMLNEVQEIVRRQDGKDTA